MPQIYISGFGGKNPVVIFFVWGYNPATADIVFYWQIRGIFFQRQSVKRQACPVNVAAAIEGGMMYKRIVGVLSLLVVMVFCIGVFKAGAVDDLLEMGVSQYKAENYEEALVILQQAKQQRPDSSIASYYLGLTYKQMGNSREAAASLKDAVGLTPSVPEAYPELIEVLYNINELDKASDLIKKSEVQGTVSGRILFLKGLVLSKEGKDTQALEAFKEAKKLQPSLGQAADLQIAMIYIRQKKTSEARESLKAVIEVEPLSEAADFAKEYQKAIKDAETYRAWRFLVGAAYQYDDNVVLKPSEAIPDVLITGEKDSSIVGTVRIDYVPLFSGPWFLNTQFNLYTNTHFHTHSHDIISPTLTLNPGLSFKTGAVSVPVLYNFVWLDNREYEGIFAVRPTYTHVFNPANIGQVSAGYTRRDILQSELMEDENRDGNIYALAASYIHPFSKDKGVFNLRYEFSRDITAGKNWENTGNRIDVSLLVPLRSNVSFILSGEAFLQDYNNVHSVFGVKRRDRTYLGSANMICQISKPLALNVQYTHTTAVSNIPLYEYDRNVYAVVLEYRF